MKKRSLFTTFIFFLLNACVSISYAQEKKADTIYFVSGSKEIVFVTKISEKEISYTFPNESLENIVSNLKVNKIIFGSGRIQKFSEIIEIKGEEDWAKVQLTKLESEITGLVRKGEVKGKGLGNSFSNINTIKANAEERMKREAAKLGAHIILIQDYNVLMDYAKVNISGIAYGYK